MERVSKKFKSSLPSFVSFFFLSKNPCSSKDVMDSDTDDDNEHTQKYERRLEFIERTINEKGLALFCLGLLNDRQDERARLAPCQWISSGLIHLFIEYYRRVVSVTDVAALVKKKVFFFETTFMSDFSYTITSRYENTVPVARILFQNDFWVLPVNVKNSHWALAIVCYPSEEKKARIVILDSFQSLSSRPLLCSILENVRVYFKQQFAHRYKEEHAREIDEYPPWVQNISLSFLAGTPQQSNAYDCGVFLIYFLRVFLFTPLLEWKKSCAWCRQLAPDMEIERKRLTELFGLLENASISATAKELVPGTLVTDIQTEAKAVKAFQVGSFCFF